MNHTKSKTAKLKKNIGKEERKPKKRECNLVKKANTFPRPLGSREVVRETRAQPSALICALIFDESLSTFLPLSRRFLLELLKKRC